MNASATFSTVLRNFTSSRPLLLTFIHMASRLINLLLFHKQPAAVVRSVGNALWDMIKIFKKNRPNLCFIMWHFNGNHTEPFITYCHA